MFKFIFSFIFVLVIAYFGLIFAGFQFHPENVSYYLPKADGGGTYEIEFASGRTVTAQVISESDTSIRLSLEGTISDVSKSLIKSKKKAGGNPVADLIENAQKEWEEHPLVDRRDGDSPATGFDKGATDVIKAIAQVDKIEQMEKMKKQIDEVKAEQDKRNKLVEEMMNT